MYAAKLHSSRLQGPTERDLRSLKHTLTVHQGHYSLQIVHWKRDYRTTCLQHTMALSLSRRTDIPLDLRCYTDSDWAGDKTTRRSTSGWLRSLLGTPLSYASRTQATVTLSSAEAELMALSSGMAESLHLQQLIEELQPGMCTTTFSYSNNNMHTATSLASKLGMNRRSRHIALRYLWIQDLRQAGEVDIKRDSTHENPADIYTNLPPAATLQKHLPQNGLPALLDGEGEEECMYYLKSKKKNTEDKDNKKSNDNDDNKVFRQNHYTTCTRPSSSTRSKMESYKNRLENYDNWLEREMQKYEA